MRRRAPRLAVAEHPARFVVLVFALAIGVGTLLLLLPWSTAAGRRTDLLTALFTSTSAICVTGLAVVDTGSHWSPFGELVILVLVQLGGLGFMTIASLIAMLVSRRLGLRLALITSRERSTLTLGDVRRVLRAAALITATVEVSVAIVLAARFRWGYGYSWATSAWHGAFHSVTAFNNAGFALYPDSLVRFGTDALVTGPIAVAVLIGGLGFPVLVDLFEQRRVRRWSRLALHSRITLAATAGLLVVGALAIGAAEWTNPGTFGGTGPLGRAWLATFGSVTPRTAGFHVVPVEAMTDEGLLATMVLMFVGAGSAGTSGGIKVGTAAVLALVVWAQLRGREDVEAFRRRIPAAVQREATTVVLLAFLVVVATTVLLLASSAAPMRDAGFEAVSAFGTVGLSTGITPSLPAVGHLGLVATMLVGRVGPVTLGMALVLRQRTARTRLPEEAPLIG
ncbi:MAG TPA: potassium transporter TrkG [Aquihabitans sp.]|nr:potassium transporter TrkG [Aquihabitans sp.]